MNNSFIVLIFNALYSICFFINDIDVIDFEKPVLESVIKLLLLLLTRNIGQYFAYRSYRTITSFLAKLN